MIIQDSSFLPPAPAKPRASDAVPASPPIESPTDSVDLARSASSAPLPGSSSSVAAGGSPVAPTSAPSPSLTPSAAMRAISQIGRIPKDGHQYQVAARAQAADGSSTYVAYREGSWLTGGTSQAGYVAATAGDGTIRWEAAVEDVLCLGVDGRQNLHVITAKEHLCLAPDGGEISRESLPMKPSQAWVDAGSGAVLYLDDQHHLAATPGKTLPAELGGRYVSEFLPARDGSSLTVRAGDLTVRLRSDGTTDSWKVPATETQGKMTNAVTHMTPLPDGNALCTVTQNIEIRSPMRFRGGFGGSFGGGFGGGFMGHEPDMGEWITRTLYRKTTPDGAQIWQTTTMTDRSVVGAAADGTVYCTTGDKGPGDVYPVVRIKDDGSTELVTGLRNPPRAMHTTADALWIWGDGELKGVRADGTVVDGSCPKGWTPMGRAHDQRLFVQDQGNRQLALLDPVSGSLTELTDTLVDHSFQRQGELERIAATLPPPDAHGEIRDEQDWIVIGNVRVPKNPS